MESSLARDVKENKKGLSNVTCSGSTGYGKIEILNVYFALSLY